MKAPVGRDGQERWSWQQIDTCLAPIVKALQEGGIDMLGSCCSHGKAIGRIDLADGHTLLIVPREDVAGITEQCPERSSILWWGLTIPLNADREA